MGLSWFFPARSSTANRDACSRAISPKSFLAVVTSAEERRAIRGLIGEIEQPARSLDCRRTSPGYWTFLGEQTHYEPEFGRGRIRLENRVVNGAPSLVIRRIPIA